MKNCLMILTILTGRVIHSMTPPWTQDVNQTYMLLLEGVLDVFWKSYVRSIYVLCPWGGAETCYKNWGVKIEKWGTKRFPTDFSKFSEQLFSIFFNVILFQQQIDFKGALNMYFTHYSCAVIILLNTGLYKSAFSTCSLRKPTFLFFCHFCAFCLFFMSSFQTLQHFRYHYSYKYRVLCDFFLFSEIFTF